VPDLVPPCRLVPYDLTLADARRLDYPLFVKPVKATFSVLARRCDTPEQLIEHLRFKPWEKHIIQRLIAPHDQALRRFPEFRIGSQHLVIEPVLRGRQINVDGFVHGGNVHLLGITDEVMYPGTMAFLRFQFTGTSDERLAARVRDAIERTVRALDLDHGFFNLEFFVDEATDALTLIEVNPRLAAQLAQFYEWVLGVDTYELGFAMALGRPLPMARGARWGAAASFVWRSFDGTSCPRLPTPEDRQWLAREFPEARLELYPKRGAALQRDIKWLGSHRWAVLNMPGRDADDLRLRYLRICDRLGWPAPY
jgi:biotin carboxylase